MLTRDQLITHVLQMKQKDETYARWALANYVALLPWLDLNAGVRDALKGAK